MRHSERGFTLIELLIVVAIIAILAAIAVPNFLEAQVRAKVARAKNDLRVMATGVESYYVDYNTYPQDGDDINPLDQSLYSIFDRLKVITTPIAYIPTLYVDPFNTTPSNDPSLPVLFPGEPPYVYIYNTFGNNGGIGLPGQEPPDNNGNPDNYGLTSVGPNRLFDAALLGGPIEYDPSNGTVSAGDINRFGGVHTPLTP